MIATLACDLPMDSKTRKECGAPKNTSCLFASTADVLDADEDPDFDLRIPGKLVKDAVQHILAFHKKEFQRMLPAWMSRSHQYQLKKKPKLDVPCSKESHESMRLKAVARHYAMSPMELLHEEAVACPRCKETVYLPRKDQIDPRITAERDKSERPKGDPATRPVPLSPILAQKVLTQQGSPDLDK